MQTIRLNSLSTVSTLAITLLVSASFVACAKEKGADTEFVATDGKNSAIIYYVGVAAPEGSSLPISGKTLACWYRSDVPNQKLANLAQSATLTDQQAHAAFFGPGARTRKLTAYPSSCTDFTRLSSRMLDGADYDGMCKTEFAASGPSQSALEGANEESMGLIEIGNVLGGLAKFGQAATLIGSFSPNSSFGKTATSIGNGASGIGGMLGQVGVVTSSVQSPAGTSARSAGTLPSSQIASGASGGTAAGTQAAPDTAGKSGAFLNLLLGMGLSRVSDKFAPLAQSAMQSTIAPSYKGLSLPAINNPLSTTDRSQLSTGFSLGNTLFGNRAAKAPAGASLTDPNSFLNEPVARASPRGGTEAHPEVSMSQLDALAAGAKANVGTKEWVTLDGAAIKFPACPDL